MGEIVVARNDSAASVARVKASCLPLAFLSAGQRATILKVRGDGQMRRHLEDLGFVEGAQVGVVCSNAGNLIVEVKGVHVAIDKQAGMKIMASPL